MTQTIYDNIVYLLNLAGVSFGDSIVPKIIIVLFIAVLLLVGVALMVMFFTWMERKVLGHVQVRLGPMITGPHGLLQPIVDGIKLLTKEDTMPKRADKWLYFIAPLIVFVPSILVFIPMPFGQGAIVSDLPMGILYIMAISAISPVGILVAGWASDNKYALLGSLRAVAQDISYEIPMALTVIGVVLITGSLSMQDIVLAQGEKTWFVFLQPLGFIIFLIAAIAEMSRIPFDLHESESEFVAGFFTEYSGMKFAFFFLAEYAHLFGISAVMATLYFGGWQGPLIPGIPVVIMSIGWFTIKVLAIVFFTIWLRGTVPRVRVDQILSIGWKVMIPLALLNLFITGLLVAGGVL